MKTERDAAEAPPSEAVAAEAASEPARPVAGAALLAEMLVADKLRARNLPGVVVGKLVALGPGVTVAFDERPEGVPARSTLALAADDVGREVTLVFERGLFERPIVTGVIRPDAATDKHHLEVDGDRLVLSAARQIELRCGKASIILTRAGKVLIHGAYVSSRASGVNRIRGGSVDIN